MKKDNSKKNPLVSILIAALSACVLFSGFQMLYIFALTTGQAGIFSYMNKDARESAAIEEAESASDVIDSSEVQRTSAVADPEFSLEEFASVTDPNKQTLSTTEIVSNVSPAIVSVYIMGEANGQEATLSSGSGFIISEEGYVVTNAHVIDDAYSNPEYTVSVKVPGYDDLITAEIVGKDDQTDIAVIKLMDENPYTYVVLGDSDTLQVGELVIAIGNPLGRLEGTVTVGVVSALDRSFNNNGYTMSLIQTDASINSGNSGGALINSFGEVIGVTNAKMSSAEGLGFAIPITPVKSIIESIINYGYVMNRPYLGVTVALVYDNAYYGAKGGVYVADITAGGPAYRAGLQVGDRIISFDGVEIDETSDIIDVRDSHSVGDQVSIVVDRNGSTEELTIIIGDSHEADN